MTEEKEEIFAFIKYQGDLVKEGYLDAKKSGEVLVGIDELIRYFVHQENPQIRDFEFEIPVRIRKGSWETIFPENLDSFTVGAAFTLWMAGKYAGSFLEEMGKNDAKDLSLKLIFQKAIKGAIYVIKLSKHLGSISKKKFENISLDENRELIKITNENGEVIWIPNEVLELYSNCPQAIFNKLTKIIEEERELIISTTEENIVVEETITTKHKYIFTKPEDDDDEIVLPELKHGDYIEIQGHITRGNEKSNTIGFLYEGHIITCFPDKGNIKQYKSNLFNNCLLKGFVDRLDKAGIVKEKRPRIKFIEIVNLDKPTLELF